MTPTIHCLLFVALLQIGNAYRILCLFPVPTRSHHIVFSAFTDGLLEKGHELVVATPFPVKNPHKNLTQIDWHNANEIWQSANFADVRNMSMFSILKNYFETTAKLIDMELSHPEIRKLIENVNDEHFDIVVVQNHLYEFYAFSEIFKAPLIVFSPSDAHKLEHIAIGNVVHPLAAPIRVGTSYGTISFAERVKAVASEIMFYFFHFYRDYVTKLIRKKHFGQNAKSLVKLSQQIDWLFTNSDPAFGYIRPITPKTVRLGFIHIKEPKPLPIELQNYLDESSNGVIYCSFGSLVQAEMFSEYNIQIFLKSFSKLKYNILFKFESQYMNKLPKNVKNMKWLPQSDLLAHKNIKLFITQGGQQSMEEGIYRGVPLLVIPFFGEHFVNAKRIEARKLGKSLDINTINTNTLTSTIEEIISKPIYKENIVKLSQIVKDAPMPPLQKAVWWTEYAIRNKGSKDILKYQGMNIPLYQYFYLDICAAVVCIVIMAYLLFKMLMKIFARALSILKQVISKIKID